MAEGVVSMNLLDRLAVEVASHHAMSPSKWTQIYTCLLLEAGNRRLTTKLLSLEVNSDKQR